MEALLKSSFLNNIGDLMSTRILTTSALCLLAGAAQAQSSVTLYGTLDAGIIHQSTSAAGYSTSVPGMASNTGRLSKFQDGGIGASFFGFKGTEDLGGGMKAHFQMQGNISLATGAGNPISGTLTPSTAVFNQIATVGLGGDFGDIKIGRQISPLYYALAFTDPREGRYFGSILGALVGINSSAGWSGYTTNAPLGAIYDDNSVVYTSPNLRGFTAQYQHTFGNIAGNSNAGARDALTLQYRAGGLKASAAYYNARDAYTLPAAATGASNNRLVHLGASYTQGDFSVSGGYMGAKNPSSVASGQGILSAARPSYGSASGNANYDVFSLGGSYQAAPLIRLTAGLYRINDKANSANSSRLWAVGLDYRLSPRTTAYVQAGQVDNKGTMNQALVYGVPVAAGQSTTAYMVGIRHSF